MYNPSQLNGSISIAPMMEWTDRHYRHMMRQISRSVVLYTEMVTAQALTHGDPERLLGQCNDEKTVAQLGGDDPARMARAARIAADLGYRAVNINVGCPSDRVQSGSFGACLMADPGRVSDIVAACAAESRLPVSVKCRIGIDGRESYDDLADFTSKVSEHCSHFIVHARIAVLKGLSPKENRTVPPLRYADVFRLKKDFKHLCIEINGGIRSFEDTAALSGPVDGAMIGRAAYENPLLFAACDRLQGWFETFFSNVGHDAAELNQPPGGFSETSAELDRLADHTVELMADYIDRRTDERFKPWHAMRHMMGLYYGRGGARTYKRFLSENGPGATGGSVLLDALEHTRAARHLVHDRAARS